jgi:hypothetical protein
MTGHHHDGDRQGLHGMVLFGRTAHYLEHIPMFTRPHNEQSVLRVTIRDAQNRLVDRDFSDQAYSIQPTGQFSLDDVALRTKGGFVGDIFRGNFEAGGAVIVRGAKITVEEVLVARNLPGTEPIAAGQQEYFLIGEPDDAYLTNFIRSERGFQQILRVDNVDGITPSPSRVRRVVAASPERLRPGDVSASMPKAGAAGTRVQLAIGAELWCLSAPDFVEPCR